MSDYQKYFRERYSRMLMEQDFDVTREALDGIEDWKNVETSADTLSSLEDVSDDGVETLEVIDKDAWTEDDLQDSYDGKVILECVACHSRITVDQADVYEDEETHTACPDIICPVCHAELGYTILGKIEKFNAPDKEEEEEKLEFPDEEDIDVEEEQKKADEETKMFGLGEYSDEDDFEESLYAKIRRARLSENKLSLADRLTRKYLQEALDEEFIIVDPKYPKHYFFRFSGDDEPLYINNIDKAKKFTTKADAEKFISEIGQDDPATVIQQYYPVDEAVKQEQVFKKGSNIAETLETDEACIDECGDQPILEAEEEKDYLVVPGDLAIAKKINPDEVLGEAKHIPPGRGIVTINKQREAQGLPPMTDDEIDELIKKQDAARARKDNDLGGLAGLANLRKKYNTDESLTEAVNNLSLDTDDTHLEMTADENGRISVISEPTTASTEEVPDTAVEGEDSIVPLDMGDMAEVEDNISPEEQAEIMDTETEPEALAAKEQTEEGPEEESAEEGPVEEAPAEEEEEFEVEAESFNYLGNTFAKKLYENVKLYRMTSSKEINGKMVVEGIIKFNSGNSKKTTFIFDEARETRSGRVVLEGINPTFFNKKAFNLRGKLVEGKLICESLKYNYSINRLNESTGKSEPIPVRGIIRSK